MEHPDFTRTAALVRRAQNGDASATDALFRRYYRYVRPYARARLGPAVRRDFDSMDIVHEAFAVALRKLDDFELQDEASFIRWMRRIVERQITDKAHWQRAKLRDRAKEVRIALADDSTTSGAPEMASPRTGPLDAMVRSDRRQRIEAQLEQLPEHYRQVITMRIHEGLGWVEISERLADRSPDAVRMIFANAMKMLMQRVHPQSGP